MKPEDKINKSTQGSCLLFQCDQEGINSSLRVNVMKERSLCCEDAEGFFIDNTVLTHTPTGGCGLLISFTTETDCLLEEAKWDLGVF